MYGINAYQYFICHWWPNNSLWLGYIYIMIGHCLSPNTNSCSFLVANNRNDRFYLQPLEQEGKSEKCCIATCRTVFKRSLWPKESQSKTLINQSRYMYWYLKYGRRVGTVPAGNCTTAVSSKLWRFITILVALGTRVCVTVTMETHCTMTILLWYTHVVLCGVGLLCKQ